MLGGGDASRPEATMSFGDHLEELRRRVFLALVVPVPLMVVLFIFGADVRRFLCEPLLWAMRSNGIPAQVSVLSPTETMMTDLKLSLILAIVVAVPWVLWQLWQFVAPGLHRSEQRYVRLLLPGSGVLALTGVALLYWVMLPLMLNVLVGFSIPPQQVLPAGTTTSSTSSEVPASSAPIAFVNGNPAAPRAGEMWINTATKQLCIALPIEGEAEKVQVASVALENPGELVPSFRLSEYLDFVLLFAAGFALAFQLPIVMLLLSWIGIVQPEMLRRHRRYAVFGVAVIAALIAPGDLLSLVIVAVPLYLLYEFSIWLIVVAPPSKVSGGRVLSQFGERLRVGKTREGDVGDE
jgi:sec-independent protein translocase protein TatC